MKGQVIAIALVIASGIAVFVMALCAYASLKEGQLRFYREHRFADVFSHVRRCPRSIVSRIESIPGVSTAETRIVFDVLVNVRGMTDPATGTLISIAEDGQEAASRLNRVYITRGRMIEPGRSDEVVVSEAFAEAHALQPGESVEAVLNGRLQRLHIVGIALSPEYVMQIQPGSLLPDMKRYGIFWVGQRSMEAAFDMQGAFNNVTLKLTHGARVKAVIDELDDLLDPYGSTGAFDRSEVISHQFVNDELKQLQTMATLAPAIFLSVAAFLLNIVVSRIITQQREQIAALKAFGYSNWEVGSHYLSLVLTIALGGMTMGTLFGVWMAKNLTVLYQQFYKFPVLRLEIDALALLVAFLLTTLVAVIGTWLAVKRAIELPPAEAMRPESPATFRLSLMERWLPTKVFPAEIRMILRNVQRRPFKSLASIFGISMSVAVLIVGSFSLDSLDYLIEFQFRKAQRQDLSVTFSEASGADAEFEIANLSGVRDSEVIRAVPARLRAGHREKRLGVTGLNPNPELFRLLDTDENAVTLPPRGVTLNTALANILGVELGDTVEVEVMEGKRPRLTLEVTALVNEFGGTNAYMDKSYLHELLGESEAVSGAFLAVDSEAVDTVYNQLKHRPGVQSVSNKEAAIESFIDTIAENMLTMRTFNVMFAVAIAIGVVYNSARISLSEQSRDLATMRVVGFYTREVATVLLGEITLFTAFAIPIGCVVGYLLAWGMILGLATENYRIPLVVSPATFAFASTVVVIATCVSALVVRRRIENLDLVAALKMKD